MADVARLAGVSAMTVSRALRREGSVSERTRSRILQVIDEIGYVPDQSAGALSSGRSGLVGALLPTLALPTYARVAQGLSDTLFEAGLQLFLGFSEYNVDREEEMLRAMLKRRPEALLLSGLGDNERIARLVAGIEIPVIEFLDGANPPIDHLIQIEAGAVGRETVAYLARKGRSRIAVAVWRDGDLRGEARLRGILDAAREAGLPEPLALRVGEPSQAIEHGARAAALLVEGGLPVDALVLLSDRAAIGALSGFREAGVRVPEDVAVFGFGDCEVARHMTPSLTSISFNAVGAGVEIGKIMLSALEASRLGIHCPAYRLTLDFHVVERASA